MISLPKLLFILAIFASSDTPEPPAPPMTVSDYTALFTQSNEVEACVQNVRESMDRYCNEAFYEIMEAGCYCMRDWNVTLMSEAAVTDPAIQNAILQLNMNPELLRNLYDEAPTGMGLVTYLLDHLEAETGIMEAELQASLDAAGDEAGKLETYSDAELLAFKTSIPSCKNTIELTQKFIPDWDTKTNPDDDLIEYFCAPKKTEPRVCKLPQLPKLSIKSSQTSKPTRIRGTSEF